MTDDLLRIDGLRKEFVLHDGRKLHAVRDVSFRLGRGETLGLVGESGSGKSTVGRCILNLLTPTAGNVVFEGRSIAGLTPREMQPLRSQMQLVFQDPFSSLNPHMRIHDIVAEPLLLHFDLSAEQRKQKVDAKLQRVGLDATVGRYFPGDLTASEQQRAGIARAFISEPKLVILDEPTSALDPRARANILDLLKDLQDQTNVSYIFISHDMNSVAKISDSIAVMYLGALVEKGPAQDILSTQNHPYSKALLSSVLFADPNRPPINYELSGEIPSAINPKNECTLYGRCPIRQDICKSDFPALKRVAPNHSSACFLSDQVSVNQQPQKEDASCAT